MSTFFLNQFFTLPINTGPTLRELSNGILCFTPSRRPRLPLRGSLLPPYLPIFLGKRPYSHLLRQWGSLFRWIWPPEVRLDPVVPESRLRSTFLVIFPRESMWYDHIPKYYDNCKIQGHNEQQCYVLHPELYPKAEGKDAEKKN